MDVSGFSYSWNSCIEKNSCMSRCLLTVGSLVWRRIAPRRNVHETDLADVLAQKGMRSFVHLHLKIQYMCR